MSQVTQLLATIKRQLKLQGKTYRDVAAALDLSEPSVKRRLRARFAELHEDSLASPLPKRRGSGLLLALREWERAAFAALRRGDVPVAGETT